VLKTTLRHYLEQMYTNRDLAFWFDPLVFREDPQNNAIRVSFPHALFGQWFMHTVRRNFESCAQSFLQTSMVYDLPSLLAESAPRQPDGPNLREAERADPVQRSGQKSLQPPAEQTFASFLVNKKNDFPLAAAKKAALHPDTRSHSPFIIYGPSGSGKTHLLNSMANAFSGKFPELPFHYGSVDSLGLIPETSRKIFLDDLQRISLFPELQDVLTLLLDRLALDQGLFVCALDSHPAYCAGLQPKLLSRLSSGLVLELKKPDLDIRRRYIHAKNKQFGLEIGKDQELILAQRYQDFRSIDGILARISAYRSTINRNADIAAILEKETEQKALTPEDIISVIAGHYNFSPDDLVQKKRGKSLTLPRQISIYLVRELLGLSLMRLGKIFGGRDHSSILYSIKKINELRKSDQDMHKILTELKHLCLSRP
jgi:chromosomal replication initiator protein